MSEGMTRSSQEMRPGTRQSDAMREVGLRATGEPPWLGNQTRLLHHPAEEGGKLACEST
jgi:hypothetical protein